MQSGKSWHFLCNDWLDITEGDGSIMKNVPLASADELNDLEFLFQKLLYHEFFDAHIWLSH